MSSVENYCLIQHDVVVNLSMKFVVLGFSKPDISFRFKRKELAEELQKRSDSLSKLEVDR